MSRMENLLRAAARETAAEVRPDSIPPLDTSTLPVPRRLGWRIGGPLSPLYAAVAVVLVAALSLTLAAVLSAGPPPAAPSFAGVPPYYVALTATGTPADSHPVDLTVRSTFTGAVLATVAAPRPYGTFTLVDGTADDRTFLVAAQVSHLTTNIDRLGKPIAVPMRLFWLRYDPASGRARLTALRVPQFDGEWVRSASVSPDGTRLAVLYVDKQRTQIRVYTLPSGAEHTFSITANQQASLAGVFANQDEPAAIAWGADDRTLSFEWVPTLGVYALDTAAAGSDLMSASRLVLPWTGSGYAGTTFQCDDDPFRSANGKYILCGGSAGPPVTYGFGEFAAATGKLITILDAQHGPLPKTGLQGSFPTTSIENASAWPYLMWASPDARILIGLIYGHAVVISDGRTRTIPWPPAIIWPPGSPSAGAAW